MKLFKIFEKSKQNELMKKKHWIAISNWILFKQIQFMWMPTIARIPRSQIELFDMKNACNFVFEIIWNFIVKNDTIDFYHSNNVILHISWWFQFFFSGRQKNEFWSGKKFITVKISFQIKTNADCFIRFSFHKSASFVLLLQMGSKYETKTKTKVNVW